jgi:membrane-bound serine protease (ClpP class)
MFEFLNPGAVAPGLIGSICLLVALFALNMLPINYAGAGLVLLGIGLMVAEAHIGSFGVIGIGGVIAFLIGALMMFPAGAPGFNLSLWVVAAATLATAGFFLLVVSLLLRSRRRPVVIGNEALLGAEGEALVWQGETGTVRVKGEIWRARAARPLRSGSRVRVVDRDGLVLVVEAV